MSKRNWIKAFAPLDRQRLLQTAAESVNWIEQYGHVDGDVESWDVMPGKQVEKDALLLDDASLYAGAAGIALLYLKYYVAWTPAMCPTRDTTSRTTWTGC